MRGRPPYIEYRVINTELPITLINVTSIYCTKCSIQLLLIGTADQLQTWSNKYCTPPWTLISGSYLSEFFEIRATCKVSVLCHGLDLMRLFRDILPHSSNDAHITSSAWNASIWLSNCQLSLARFPTRFALCSWHSAISIALGVRSPALSGCQIWACKLMEKLR